MTKLAAGLALASLLLGCHCGGSTSPEPGSGARQPPAVAPHAATPGVPDLPPIDPREANLSAAVLRLLETQHVRHKAIDDAVSRAAYARFLDQLDPGKVFLLAADAAALEPHATKIDDELRSGRLETAHEGAERFHARLAVVQQVVAGLLAQPFDSSDEEWIETDPKKLELAKTEDELKDRWRQRLELEVMERVALMDERADALAKAAKEKGKAKPKKAKGTAKGDERRRTGVVGDGPNASIEAPAVDDDDDASTPALSARDIPPTAEGREAKARADLAKSYAARFARLANPDKLDAAATLVNAVTWVFDPHTNYLPPSDEANFNIQMTGSLEGIGAVLREDDHYIRVVELVPGGASWRQGDLEAGDIIQNVAQAGKEAVDVADMRIDDVVQMVRGPKDTVVTLTVQKPEGEVKSISITRDVVVIEDAYARGATIQPKSGGPAIGYIYLPSFYGGHGDSQRSSAGDVHRLLDVLAQRKVAGVIIDIRGNGGGLLDDARVMTGLLIDKGPVVQTKEADGEREILADDVAGTSFDGPVVVMVDQFSASASEILAAALQDYHRAIIVGTGPTHGKGTVQVLADLDRMSTSGDKLGVLKLTVQQFFRVNGASTQWQGVVPDVVMPNPAGYVDTGERTLDNSIPWSQIDPVAHTDWPARWKVAELAARSQKRQVKNTVFPKVVARTELLKARRDQTRQPLQQVAWLAERAKQRAALDAVTPDLEGAPSKLAITEVVYDGHAPVAARPGAAGKKVEDRGAHWRDQLARDPWLDEATAVLRDAAAAK